MISTLKIGGWWTGLDCPSRSISNTWRWRTTRPAAISAFGVLRDLANLLRRPLPAEIDRLNSGKDGV